MKRQPHFFAFFMIVFTSLVCSANREQIVAVTIQSAKLADKTVFVRHLDGKEETITFTKDTPITSLAEAAISKSLHGGAGYQFLVYYTEKAAKKTAHRFDYIGREEWKTVQGDLIRVDLTSRKIIVLSADSSEIALLAGKQCAAATTDGVKKFIEWGSTPKMPSKVTIYLTEVKGQKLAHLIEYPLQN